MCDGINDLKVNNKNENIKGILYEKILDMENTISKMKI